MFSVDNEAGAPAPEEAKGDIEAPEPGTTSDKSKDAQQEDPTNSDKKKLGPPTPSEGEPWKSISYIAFTIQFFFITLDLFVETYDDSAWHYAINSVEFAISLYLAFYQPVRIYQVFKKGISSSVCAGPIVWLVVSFVMQLFILLVTIFWFDIENDRETNYLEWALFGVSLVWGFVNPITFSSVNKAYKSKNAGEVDEDVSAKGKMTPGRTIISVFTKHFTKKPILFVAATIFASGSAILTTFQGAVINDLTRVVTRGFTQGPEAERQIASLSGTLAGVWFAANLCRFLFDLTSASMFSSLEVWLKRTIFHKAMVHTSTNPNAEEGSSGEYLARYTSDVNGVMALYSTLLRGVIMNVLLIITSFVFLALADWRVATVTLGFLAMGVTSGPTDLAGSATADTQIIATKGMSFFSDELRDGPTADVSTLTKKHEDEFLAPLQQSLWKQSFYANSVDSYIHFFASFLTVIVVITMTWEVYFGKLNSSDFLGIFFVYRQLQKPAMKISSVIKSAVRRSANVKRVNEVIFESS